MKSSDSWLRPPAGSVGQKQIPDQPIKSLRPVSRPRDSLLSHAKFLLTVPLKRHDTWHMYVQRSSALLVTLDQPSGVTERSLASVASSRVAPGLWICWTNQPGHSFASRAPGEFHQLWLNNANYISSFLWLVLVTDSRVTCTPAHPGSSFSFRSRRELLNELKQGHKVNKLFLLLRLCGNFTFPV